MLEADAASRRRVRAVGAAILVLLGGFALSGAVERFLPQLNAPSETEAPSPAQLAAFRAEAKRLRAVRKQLAAHGAAGEWRAAVAAADRALAAKEERVVRRLRAEALFRSGEHAEGGIAIAESLRAEEEIPQAAALLLRGDLAGYRRMCEAAMRRNDPEAAPDALDANNLAWLCAIGPDALEDLGPAVALARSAVARAGPDEKFTYLNTLGAVLYRSGQDREAVERLMEAERLQEDAFNWPFLAMAHGRLGEADRARAYLNRLRKQLDETYATPGQQDSRHELLLFLREAESVVDGR